MNTPSPQVLFALVLSFTLNAAAATRYVDVNNPSPAPPYTNWATAATDIQSAIDDADAADLILVTNGIYQTGGRMAAGGTNRVAVDKPLMVQSVNGPEFTVIRGYQVPGTTNGDSAIRCVYLANGASLSGFTLSHGATTSYGLGGGGACCESTGAWLSNCVLAYNSAYNYGGGALSGTLTDCMLSNNVVSYGCGGGAAWSTLTDCTLTGNSAPLGDGGAACWSELTRCILSNNVAGRDAGGGAFECQLTNCTLLANSAPFTGGGASFCTLENCTLTSNVASNGGGVYLCTLFHCTLSTNTAWSEGGGAHSSILNDCLVAGNTATTNGGGTAADRSPMNRCTLIGNRALWGYGGGTYAGQAKNYCTLIGNSALLGGGGACDTTLNNCVLTANTADFYGGGAIICQLNNCTLAGNSAYQGGGALECWLFNCVVYYNSATNEANCSGLDTYSTLSHCCTTPIPTNSVGNFTNAPLFVNLAGGDLRLQPDSPCINAGTNAYAKDPTDLDGNPRIVGGTVDIGAYECQSPALLDCFTWLQSYGLPTDAAELYVDADGDRLNNWQEWRASTVPTNAASVLKMLSSFPGASGVQVSWQSVSNVTYFLERSANLAAPAFSAVASNLVGQAGTTIHTDTSAAGSGPFFYRVGVQ